MSVKENSMRDALHVVIGIANCALGDDTIIIPGRSIVATDLPVATIQEIITIARVRGCTMATLLEDIIEDGVQRISDEDQIEPEQEWVAA